MSDDEKISIPLSMWTDALDKVEQEINEAMWEQELEGDD